MDTEYTTEEQLAKQHRQLLSLVYSDSTNSHPCKVVELRRQAAAFAFELDMPKFSCSCRVKWKMRLIYRKFLYCDDCLVRKRHHVDAQ